MYFNINVHNKIKKTVELKGYLFEEFDIKELNAKEINERYQISGINYLVKNILVVEYLMNPSYVFGFYEIDSRISFFYSPAEYKTLQSVSQDNFNFNYLNTYLIEWLESIQKLSQVRNIVRKDISISEKIKKFSNEIDKYDLDEEEYFDENEIDELKKSLEDLKNQYEKQIDGLLETIKDNREETTLIQKELRYIKNEIERISDSSEMLPKKEWAKNTYLKLLRIKNKYPKTLFYLGVTGPNPELTVTQKIVGAGLMIASETLGADQTPKDIIDMQKESN